MCSSMTKLETGTEFRSRNGKRRNRLRRILSAARKVTVGLASRAQREALRVCALDNVAAKTSHAGPDNFSVPLDLRLGDRALRSRITPPIHRAVHPRGRCGAGADSAKSVSSRSAARTYSDRAAYRSRASTAAPGPSQPAGARCIVPLWAPRPGALKIRSPRLVASQK